MKILLGIIAFIEDQGQLRALRRVTKGVAEKIMKVLDHHRKLLGIMADSEGQFFRERYLAVGKAKEGVNQPAQSNTTPFFFCSFSAILQPLQSINIRV